MTNLHDTPAQMAASLLVCVGLFAAGLVALITVLVGGVVAVYMMFRLFGLVS